MTVKGANPMTEEASTPEPLEERAFRDVAGTIMLRCGLRGLSREHGAMQDFIVAALRAIQAETRAETVREAAKVICSYCKDANYGPPVPGYKYSNGETHYFHDEKFYRPQCEAERLWWSIGFPDAFPPEANEGQKEKA